MLDVSRREIKYEVGLCLAAVLRQRLAAVLAERGIPTRLLLRNVGDALPPQGTVSQLWQSLGLDAQGIAQAVREVLA